MANPSKQGQAGLVYEPVTLYADHLRRDGFYFVAPGAAGFALSFRHPALGKINAMLKGLSTVCGISVAPGGRCLHLRPS